MILHNAVLIYEHDQHAPLVQFGCKSVRHQLAKVDARKIN